MGKKSPPPPPDYTKAAELQAASAKENLAAQTAANRPNQITPWGQQTWSSTPGADGQKQWTQTTTLSPQQQEALDSQMAVSTGRSKAAEGLLGQATNSFKSPLDYSGMEQGATHLDSPGMGTLPGAAPRAQGVGAAPQAQGLYSFGGPIKSDVGFNQVTAGSVGGGGGSSGPLKYEMDHTAGDWRQRAQDAALKFQEPLNQQRTSGLESQLANMGLTRGSEAWNTEMRNNADQTMRNQYQAFGAGQSEANMLFNQDLQSSQFTNNARGQQFDQSYRNAALGQQAGIANAQNSLTAQGMNNQNALLAAQFGNNAQSQGFQQNLQGQGFNNQVGQQNFQNNMAGQAFNNQAGQQNFQNDLSLAQAGDQQAQQKLAMQMQTGRYNQNIRQNQIAEAQQKRNQPLNELNALLSGQQIQSPSMPSFTNSGVAPGTNYSGAANQTYQAQMDAFNAKNQGLSGLMSGVSGLAGAAGGLGWMPFSDKRLKDDIKPLFSLGGDHDFKLYSFNFKPTGERKVGVLAQEVQKKRPDAVMRDPESGFLKVDYNKVFQ